ncbi:hypothetical protein MNAN1_003765 [Malassezia nana]|uniref:DASH complex subunit ASK1 n=1 Tax=Malassezia nana TaxID=180528 RepID=A0AAF0EQ50_9BASI|nr:hypothetical protein MNAN1_003765 [Malassezia nana]
MAAGEQLMQLDQAITLTLQEIDENFARAHQVVTARILPAIRSYETSCAHTWQAARFWKQFFEASAQVSLTQQPLEDLEDTSSMYEAPELGAQASGEHLTRDSDEMLSPPRLSTSRYVPRGPASPMETPFERLRRDVEASRTQDASRVHEPLPAADLSMANDPSLALSEAPRASSPLKARRRSSARPRVSVVAGQDGVPTNPFATSDAVGLWNGIADLRRTPLRGACHARAMDEDDDTSLAMPDGMSPPVTMQFSVPPSTYLKTPAREAARRVVDDLLRSVGADDADASGDAPSRAPPSSARRKSVVETPLTKRRDSLPTPPTITKVYPAPADTHEPVHSRAR